ncbi:hypothetical protein WJX72_006869 [[Myrmecia] bisecta]|uniref:cysteine dioxygenase n=1 Tax=[Myrmecia] bisecta TaxID=41462 RepID=A0AAW1PS35_9CHLO
MAVAPGSKLQHLYDLAKASFQNGRRPSPQEVHQLKAAFGAVPLEELGVKPPAAQPVLTTHPNFFQRVWGWQRAPGTRPPPVMYLHVYEDADLTIGIFCLPASATLPLHNHPGMTVLSRVLYGDMLVKAYDWADPANASAAAAAPQDAHVITDRIVRGGDPPEVLYPTSGGNMHSFTAASPCAVLDLLAPPYAPEAGRDCKYYSADKEDVHEGGTVGLQEKVAPAEFVVLPGKYQGVRINPFRAARCV